MSWAAWLVETASGAVGPRCRLLSGGKTTVAVSAAGSWELTVDGGWLDTVPMRWWYPWASGVLICRRDGDGGAWRPVMLGPATAMPVASAGPRGMSGEPVTLKGGCMREMLDRRIITGPRDWDGQEGTWDLQHQTVRFEGVALGTMMEKLIELAMARRGGRLPVVFDPALRQEGLPRDDSHTWTYYAYNLSNDGCGKLIDDLCGRINGPDWAFRPRLAGVLDGEPDRAEALFVHGVEGQPQIPQGRTVVWDATRPRGPVTGLDVAQDASKMYTRRWATGDGQDADVLMDVRQADDLLGAGMPLMEDVSSFSSSTTHGNLLSHVDALVAAGRAPTVQWTVTVDVSAPGCRLGVDWWPGDRVRLLLPASRAGAAWSEAARWRPYPAVGRELLVTVMSADCDLGSDAVKVKMQEDQA